MEGMGACLHGFGASSEDHCMDKSYIDSIPYVNSGEAGDRLYIIAFPKKIHKEYNTIKLLKYYSDAPIRIIIKQ